MAELIPTCINQRPSRIAWIDCRIRLYKIFINIDTQLAAPERGDYAHSNSLPDSERITYCQNNITYPGIFNIAECDCRQIRQIDLDNGQIRFRIRPDQFGRGLSSILKCHLDLVSRLHNMIVRQNITIMSRHDS